MKPYKPIIKEKKLLKEMAYIGNVGQLEIQVYTDHNPPHFHVVKKDEFEVTINIKTLKTINYKWQKNNKIISSSELQKIILWINKPYIKDKEISNLRAIKIIWGSLNPNKKI